tara:strand:+ start:489 stop:995 length:507 start_codon:yes stop_codon:yes gene_type:complete
MIKKKNTKKNNKINKGIPKKYQKLIDLLEDELLLLKNKNVRLLAEFDNYKKRNEQERVNLIRYEGIGFLKPILSVLDDLDRTLKISSLKKDKNLYKGIRMITEKLSVSLSNLGVKPFHSEKEIFNPDFHEALMVKKTKGKSNIVIEEYEKGYKYHDKIIRHAKVIVSE